MKIIIDKDLGHISVKDNREKMVCPKDFCKDIVIRIDRETKEYVGWQKGECLVRKSVAKKLCKAQALLPKGYKFKLWSTYRPIGLQRRIYKRTFEKLKKLHPKWTKKKLIEQTDIFVAHPNHIPPHSTGGAMDLTIVDKKGIQLDMGNVAGSESKKSYTLAKDISTRAKANRKLLVSVLKRDGFVNYPAEWWHWEYGTRLWAYVKKKKHAVYGVI